MNLWVAGSPKFWLTWLTYDFHKGRNEVAKMKNFRIVKRRLIRMALDTL